MLEKIRGLLKAETAADIRAAIDAIDLIDLRADLSQAEAARAELLLTADDKKVVAAEAVVTTKRLALERGQAAKAALETKLAGASAKEADQAFEALVDRAERATELARREIVEKVLPAAKAIIEVMGTVRRSNEVRAEVHRKSLRHMGEDSAAGRGKVVSSALNVIDDRFPQFVRGAFAAYED